MMPISCLVRNWVYNSVIEAEALAKGPANTMTIWCVFLRRAWNYKTDLVLMVALLQ